MRGPGGGGSRPGAAARIRGGGRDARRASCFRRAWLEEGAPFWGVGGGVVWILLEAEAGSRAGQLQWARAVAAGGSARLLRPCWALSCSSGMDGGQVMVWPAHAYGCSGSGRRWRSEAGEVFLRPCRCWLVVCVLSAV